MNDDTLTQHLAVLESLMHRDNLVLSFVPEMITAYGHHPQLIDFVSKYPNKVVLASSDLKVDDVIEAYGDGMKILRNFLGSLPKEIRTSVAFTNANTQLIKGKMVINTPAKKGKLAMKRKGRDSTFALNLLPTNIGRQPSLDEKMNEIGDPSEAMSVISETSLESFSMIDSHLHIFDFTHKTQGIKVALQLMDNLGVQKACALSMSHHKKWRASRRRPALYYGDDNATCYVYSAADQLLMDELLSLDEASQARFAPFMCGFDTTDMSALDHVMTMHKKYPQHWAGIGELFFRHDDLTNLSLGRDEEIPRPDHPAMMKIYEYCADNNLMVMMHHNLYRSGCAELVKDWVDQLYEVLESYPLLSVLLCHTGISRLCWDIDGHHRFVDSILTRFPNLVMDISWVVYDSVICDKKGEVRQCWLDVFEKHSTRFTIGSDQVGRFSGSLRLAQKYKKYHKLLVRLSPETASRIAHENAERLFFSNGQRVTSSRPDPPVSDSGVIITDSRRSSSVEETAVIMNATEFPQLDKHIFNTVSQVPVTDWAIGTSIATDIDEVIF